MEATDFDRFTPTPTFTGRCPVDRVPVNVGVGWDDYMLHIPAIEVLCKT